MTLSTKFADQGTSVSVLTFDDNQIRSNLEPEVYSVGFNPMSGFYLNKRGKHLSVPGKIYGSVEHKVSKILASYQRATKSFGVLLSGDKGSGKTMTSSVVANRCLEELGLPVILIESPFDGAGLSEFIEKLGECVLFIDEFGKKFIDDDGDQGSLLGLFDGTGSGRRLVLLTENRARDVNQYMLNRPGRVHYHFRHGKLDEQIVREYCADAEIPESVIEQICLRRESSTEFSFDVLQAIVNEYTAFGGDIEELCDDLNIERSFEFGGTDLEILSVKDTTLNKPRELGNNGTLPFPSSRSSTTLRLVSVKHEGQYDYAELSVKHIVKKEGEVYTFATRDDEGSNLVVTTRQKERDTTWHFDAA